MNFFSNKSKAKIATIGIIILFLQIVVPLFGTMDKAEASPSIQYLGKVTYGSSTVGRFLLNGQLAYCVAHSKSTPTSGNGYDDGSPVNTAQVRAAIYYGWGGPGNIFTDESNGIVVTSLILSRIFGDGTSGQSLNGYAALWQHVQNGDAPSTAVSFSKTSLTTSLNGMEQRSEVNTFNADVSNSIKFSIPGEVTFINATNGYSQKGGTVTLMGGQSFYFSAPAGYDTDYNTGNLYGSMAQFLPIIYQTTYNTQPLMPAYSPIQNDPSNSIGFTVDFQKLTVTITANHIDYRTNELIATEKYEVPIGTQWVQLPNGGREFDLADGSQIIVKARTDLKKGNYYYRLAGYYDNDGNFVPVKFEKITD